MKRAALLVQEIQGATPGERGVQAAKGENALRRAQALVVEYRQVDLLDIISKDDEVVVLSGEQGQVVVSSHGADYYVVDAGAARLLLDFCDRTGVEVTPGNVQAPSAAV